MTLKLGSPVATTLESVAVERGERVSKGDVIARLESRAEAADVTLNTARAESTTAIASAAAKLEFAQAEINRAERLLESNNIPRQKVEELRATLRVAQGELQLALLNRRIAQLELERSKTMLELRVIRSPIDGVVMQRMLGPGEYAHQDQQIVELAATATLNVETYPPVRYFGLIRTGMHATVQPDAPAGSVLQADVSIVDHVFDAGSGTFGVRLKLQNANGALPAGQRCRVKIETDEPTRPGPIAGAG